jgi:hypothetical protein
VRWVEVTGLTLVSENTDPDQLAKLADEFKGPVPARLDVPFARVVKAKDRESVTVTPAHLALLSPAVPDTLILRQVPA